MRLKQACFNKSKWQHWMPFHELFALQTALLISLKSQKVLFLCKLWKPRNPTLHFRAHHAKILTDGPMASLSKLSPPPPFDDAPPFFWLPPPVCCWDDVGSDAEDGESVRTVPGRSGVAGLVFWNRKLRRLLISRVSWARLSGETGTGSQTGTQRKSFKEQGQL